MFCKVCNYALWNLKDRTCPECGTGFAPSQFRFTPNSIRFLCPHCAQQYYGTSRVGHLVPDDFTCVSCQHQIRMDEMILVPAAGIDERKTRARGNPWIERAGRPTIRDWLHTTVLSMGTPAALILATSPSTRLSRTLGYAALTAALASATSVILPFVTLAPFLLPFGINAKGWFALLVWVVGVACSGLLMYVAVPIAAAASHLVLRGGKPAGTLRTTIHAAAISSGSNIFWGVPVFGFMTGPVGMIWWGVSFSVMLRVAHKVTKTRAAIAGMLVPVAIMLAFAAAMAVAIFFSVRAATTAIGTLSTSAQADVAAVSLALRDAAAEDGRERHLGSLFLEGKVTIADLLGDNFSSTSAVIAGGVDLAPIISAASETERQSLISTLDASLTPDIIAYRVGDIIVIRDIPEPPPDPHLWLAAVSLEPTANTNWYAQSNTPAAGQLRLMGMGGPSNASINPDVTDQNRIRAIYGLPALPPLHTILPSIPFRVVDSDAPPEQHNHEPGAQPSEGPQTGG
ncbi:MAG: hypothetical protein KF838_01485 [Phycisphaeraceae bacterium]|nr:MAG: hypothetical protein KF838_01485 [Phycisphaeraceae bacterium]